jgi:hypothetical protein
MPIMNPEHPVFKDFSGGRIRNKSDDRWLYSGKDFIQFAILGEHPQIFQYMDISQT